MKMRAAILLVSVLAVSSLTAAEPAAPVDPVPARFRQLERDIPSLYLLNALRLTPVQAASLAGMIEEMKKTEEDADRYFGDLAAKSTSFGDFFSLPADTKAPPAKTLKAAIDEGRKILRAKGDTLADRFINALSEEQKRALTAYSPSFIPDVGGSSSHTKGREGAVAEEALRRLRKESVENPKAAIERALDTLVPYVLEKRGSIDSEEVETQARAELKRKLVDMVSMLQAFPDTEIDGEIGGMIGQLTALNKVQDPGESRNRLRQYLMNPGILDVLQERGGVKGTGTVGYAPAAAGTARLAGKEESAAALVVLRSLSLTKEQAGRILPILESTVAARQKVQTNLLQAAKEAVPAYEALRKDLAAGKFSSPAEMNAKRCYAAIRALREVADMEALLDGEARLDAELTLVQVVMLSGDKRRVVRAGLLGKDAVVEASNRAGFKIVDTMRKMKAPDYASYKGTFGEQVVRDTLKIAGLEATVLDLETAVNRTVAVFDEARKLGEPEYAAKRGDLAAASLPRMEKGRRVLSGTRYVKGEALPPVGFATRAIFTADGVSAVKSLLGK